MTTVEKLTELRKIMTAEGIDHLLVVSDDYHQSEYVGDFFKSRAYLSGFTGSAGTLIVSKEDAKLFTDGRYYIQAENQLRGSGIELMRAGSEGVPTVEEYLESTVKSGETLAYDGRCVSAKLDSILREKLKGASFITDRDLPGMLWSDRPALPSSKVYLLDDSITGADHAKKVADVREKLEKEGAKWLVLSSLCDIAWLYNLRADDVEDTPVFLSYSIISKDEDILFVRPEVIAEFADYFHKYNITAKPYNDFYAELKKLSGKVMLDKSAVNSAIIAELSNAELIDKQNPTLLLKAVKNPTELENTKKAHIADGIAVTRLMLELKFGDRELDEITADELLWQYRVEAAEQLGIKLLGKSFGTIAAFAANAAMMHYSAKPGSAAKIDKNAEVPMLLVDSGAHYEFGTTDITRTFVLGRISDEIKMHYTLTAMGNLRLANLVFLEGATGTALDVTCREPLWEYGIDYRCGTGHGVGHILSVHEGPNRIHWRRGDAELRPGMITTDEPGVYVEGSHGIRIENELITVKGEHNEYGQFLKFENITFCPIDLDGIDPEYMDSSDIKKLNAYHKSVFDTLSPYIDSPHLAELTRAI